VGLSCAFYDVVVASSHWSRSHDLQKCVQTMPNDPGGGGVILLRLTDIDRPVKYKKGSRSHLVCRPSVHGYGRELGRGGEELKPIDR